jgi:hypothetical protein
MSDKRPEFEVEDTIGTSTSFVGAVGTGSTAVPSSPGDVIESFYCYCPDQTPVTKKLYYSINGGTTWHELGIGDAIVWSLKGEPTQIYIKGSVATVNYEIIMNRKQI